MGFNWFQAPLQSDSINNCHDLIAWNELTRDNHHYRSNCRMLFVCCCLRIQSNISNKTNDMTRHGTIDNDYSIGNVEVISMIVYVLWMTWLLFLQRIDHDNIFRYFRCPRLKWQRTFHCLIILHWINGFITSHLQYLKFCFICTCGNYHCHWHWRTFCFI